MKKGMLALGTLMSVLCVSQAWAVNDMNAANPRNWRLENYPNNVIYAWGTGSSCTSGRVQTTNLNAADRNRFYATILAAKLKGANVFVRYEPGNDACEVVSFGMDAPN